MKEAGVKWARSRPDEEEEKVQYNQNMEMKMLTNKSILNNKSKNNWMENSACNSTGQRLHWYSFANILK